MQKLTSLMLIELAKTDRAMSWAVKHNRPDVYEEWFNVRLGVISDWLDRKTLSDEEYAHFRMY